MSDKPLSRRQSPPSAVCLGKRQTAFRADARWIICAREITLAKKQYSGNARGINGMHCDVSMSIRS